MALILDGNSEKGKHVRSCYINMDKTSWPHSRLKGKVHRLITNSYHFLTKPTQSFIKVTIQTGTVRPSLLMFTVFCVKMYFFISFTLN